MFSWFKSKNFTQIWKPNEKSKWKISYIEKYRHLVSYESLKLNIKESIADCHMKKWILLYYLIKYIFSGFQKEQIKKFEHLS